jgi:(R)-2-hydroxyacyl-CoA dehydratese activating ATPase
MTITAGLDSGSTYTKAVIVDGDHQILGRSLTPTGYRLGESSERALDEALAAAGRRRDDLDYVVSTGYGRYQVHARQVNVTDLTASAWGTRALFPGTSTILDIGGQTMKASRLDEQARVRSFRLNDKCAAGTGAFLEKTARYMGFGLEEIGPLVATSHEALPISGVCAVFAESEVINHLSQGSAPADVMHGAMASLIERAVQLLRRVRFEPEVTLAGGILRFDTMVALLTDKLKTEVNIPDGDLVQYIPALGAGVLGHRRLAKLAADGAPGPGPAPQRVGT